MFFLVFRYPFHGAEHSGLFAKIRKGQFSLPESLSSRAKCLIRCLLRKEPSERLTTEDVLVHPWLTGSQRESGSSRSGTSSSGTSRRSGGPNMENSDHVVPEFRPAVTPAAVGPAPGGVSSAPSLTAVNSTSSGGNSTPVDPAAAAFHLVFRPASSSSEHQPPSAGHLRVV
jgi:serine/threonine protein kinase